MLEYQTILISAIIAKQEEEFKPSVWTLGGGGLGGVLN